MWVRIAANAPIYYEPQILAGFRRHGSNESAVQERTGASMQDMAKAIKIWKDYLPANSRPRLEQQARRYWAGISLILAQHFFSNDDVAACASQLRAAKALWNRGEHRSCRLGWKRKCVFIAHWANAPYLRCANSAGEFDLPRAKRRTSDDSQPI